MNAAAIRAHVVKHGVRLPADQFRDAPAQQFFHLGVGKDDTAIGIQHVDAFAQGCGDFLELRLAFRQRLFGTLALDRQAGQMRRPGGNLQFVRRRHMGRTMVDREGAQQGVGRGENWHRPAGGQSVRPGQHPVVPPERVLRDIRDNDSLLAVGRGAAGAGGGARAEAVHRLVVVVRQAGARPEPELPGVVQQQDGAERARQDALDTQAQGFQDDRQGCGAADRGQERVLQFQQTFVAPLFGNVAAGQHDLDVACVAGMPD